MNHIYRIVWNEDTGCFAAVAETAPGRGKGKAGRKLRHGRHLAAALLLATGVQAQAGPQGEQVTAGQGSVTRSGATTTIQQGTAKLAIEWQRFDVGANETVNFVQPSASAIALNRVVGTDGSQILGRLNANGQVFLLNPNGILFGRTAQVSVGGLVASTLSLSDADFLAGRTVLRGTGGTVVNEGTLKAADGGYIALVGAQVRNTGTVQADRGTAALAAGSKVTLDFAGDGLLKLAVDEGVLQALVHNGGVVQADGGAALLTAKAADALAATVVNNEGIVRARTLQNQGGTIKLLGGFEGGTVQVGGTLDASAPDGGNGGFVDTSGAHVKVAQDARVDTRAAQGTNGHWLIDPADFTIAASGGDISGATLSANLGLGDVTILSSSGAAAGSGDINVNDAVSWNANLLTLTAARDINIRAVMTASGTSALAMNTGTANGADAGVAGGKVKVALDPVTGFAGRVDFDRAGTGFLTINGESYLVINSLGTEGSTTGLQAINADGTLRYALGADIDAAATAGWNGGQGASPLTGLGGVLDGLGHAIANLKLRAPLGYGGLFTTISGTVRNLELANVSGAVDGGNGTLAGMATNATLHNLLASGTLTGPGNAMGGLVGEMLGGTLQDAHARVTLNMTSNTSNWIGGLVGRATDVTMRDVSASGAVTTQGYDFVGGLVGQMIGGTLQNARASGAVTGRNNVGGLLGANGDPGAGTRGADLVNVSASGTVDGKFFGGISLLQNVGGLVGWNFGNISQASATGAVLADGGANSIYNGVGGLVGVNSSGDISNAYATGSVTATGLGGVTQYVGGLAGRSTGALTSVYATGNVSSQGDYTGGLVGLNNGAVTDARSEAVTVEGAGNYTGGLIGDHSGGAVTNTSATGNVTSQGARSGGLIGRSSGVALTNARASGSVTNTGGGGTTQAGLRIGGLVGQLNGGSLTDAQASGAVTGFQYVGGLVGASSGSVTNARATGNVTAADFIAGGLIGASTAAVSNVEATGNVVGTQFVGGLVGSSLESVSDAVARGNVQGVTQVGGLIGRAGGAGLTVNNTRAEGNVRATGTGNSDAGGLIGASEHLVTNSSATGRVEADGSRVGGLIGYSQTDFGIASVGYIENLYATGDVSGVGSVGGLIGAIDHPTLVSVERIRSVYASGNVSGTGDAVGGLIGHGGAQSVTDAYATGSVSGAGNVGGLIGEHVSGTVDRTYATGAVSGTSATGGLLGTSIGGVTNSYWDTATTGQATSAGGTGRTTAQMRQASTFAGWDIGATGGTSTVWRIYEGMTAPLLRGFLQAQAVADVTTTYNAATQSGTAVPVAGTRTGTSASGRNVGTYTAWSTQQGLDIIGGLLTITPATLSVAGVTAGDKVYDGGTGVTLSAAGATIAGVLGGDSVNFDPAGLAAQFADKNVGSNKQVNLTGGAISGADAANYVLLAVTPLHASITPAALTVTGLAVTDKVYDGTLSAPLATGAAALTGVIGGDTVSLNAAGLTGAYADKNVGSNKAVTVGGAGLAGADAANYTFSAAPGLAGNITPASLAVGGVSADNKVYDGTNAATLNTGSAALVGVVAGDAVTLNAGGLSATFADRNAGNGKAVSVTGAALAGADAGNYVVTNPAGLTADITPATLTVGGVTANGKVYDATTAATLNAGAAVLNGVIGGDSVSFDATLLSGQFADKNVGNGRAVNVTGAALAGADAANYVVANPTGVTASITPATLALTGVTASDKVYDGTTTAGLNTAPAALSGVIGTDAVSLDVSGLAGSFADRNVGSNKAVGISGAALTGADAGNYVVAAPSGVTASITPKALVVSGVTANDKVYDGGTAATLNTGSGVLTGVVAGDAVTLATGAMAGSFADKNAGTGKAVTATGAALGGADAGNYTVVNPAGLTATITPASLAMTGVTANDKVYDGTTAAGVNTGAATLAGVIGADAVTLDVSSLAGSFADKNVGHAKGVALTGAALAGADAANYVLVNSALSADITPAALAVVADDQAKAAGAADPAFTYHATGLVGGETAATALGGNLARNPGEAAGPYAITQGSLSAVNGNYAIAYTPGTLTIAPPPAPAAPPAAGSGSPSGTDPAGDPAAGQVVLPTYPRPEVPSAPACAGSARADTDAATCTRTLSLNIVGEGVRLPARLSLP